MDEPSTFSSPNPFKKTVHKKKNPLKGRRVHVQKKGLLFTVAPILTLTDQLHRGLKTIHRFGTKTVPGRAERFNFLCTFETLRQHYDAVHKSQAGFDLVIISRKP